MNEIDRQQDSTDDYYKKMCKDNITSNLNIINIKKESDSNNYGIRVILDIYYTNELKNIGIF